MSPWPAILLVFTVLLARADGLENRLTVAGIAEFTAAYQAWDGKRFGAAAELFRQATTNAPGSSTNFYWLGTAQFHRLLQVLGLPASRSNTLVAETALDSALAALNTAVKLNERDPESHALLGTLCGMSIAMSPPRALWLGPRVMKHQKKALQYGPANPRVQYLLGMSHYHAGAMGRGKKEALKCLLKAEQLYADEAEIAGGPLEPRWGRSSCLAFIGKTYDALGQSADAEKYFRKALKLNPQDRLAREELDKRKP
jgi:tetratricopeptide (TPR) repeat protein